MIFNLLIPIGSLLILSACIVIWKKSFSAIKVLLLIFAIFYFNDKLRTEYYKTQIYPGNDVVYKGKVYNISCLTVNDENNYRAVTLTNSSGYIIKRNLPADSVKNNYKPFWNRIF
jgi:hypothetical protein